MSTGKAILEDIWSQRESFVEDYSKKHWKGSFADYLEIVCKYPGVTRTAYQRLYDMIVSHGTDEVYENKEKIVRFKFFADFAHKYGDAIFGLDRTVMTLVNTFKSAAKMYGTERRVLLLHGPVGSAKSTIARLLKRGLEEFSKHRCRDALSLVLVENGRRHLDVKCPMHQDPLDADSARHAARHPDEAQRVERKPTTYLRSRRSAAT